MFNRQQPGVQVVQAIAVQPVQPMQPGQPMQLVQPMQPGQPVQPGQLVQLGQPMQPGSQNYDQPIVVMPVQVPSQQIEMTQYGNRVGPSASGRVPIAAAEPIQYINEANLATRINTQSKKTTYNQKNRCFFRSMLNNVLAIVVVILFFAKFFDMYGPIGMFGSTMHNNTQGTLKYLGCFNKTSTVTLPIAGESLTTLSKSETKLKCFLPPETVVAAGKIYKCGTAVLGQSSATSSGSSSTSVSGRRRRRTYSSRSSSSTSSTSKYSSVGATVNGQKITNCETPPSSSATSSSPSSTGTGCYGSNCTSNSPGSTTLNPNGAPIGYRGYTLFMFREGYTPTDYKTTGATMPQFITAAACSTWNLFELPASDMVTRQQLSNIYCTGSVVDSCQKLRADDCEKTCLAHSECNGAFVVERIPRRNSYTYSAFKCFAERSGQSSQCGGSKTFNSNKALYKTPKASSTTGGTAKIAPVNRAMISKLPNAAGYQNPDDSYCYNVDINPVESDLFTKVDDLECGWDRRGGAMDQGMQRLFFWHDLVLCCFYFRF